MPITSKLGRTVRELEQGGGTGAMGTASYNPPESARFGGPRGPFTLPTVHSLMKSPKRLRPDSTDFSDGCHVPSLITVALQGDVRIKITTGTQSGPPQRGTKPGGIPVTFPKSYSNPIIHSLGPNLCFSPPPAQD